MIEPAANDAHEGPGTIPWPPILLVGIVVSAIVLQHTYPLAWPGERDLIARLVGHAIGLAGLALFIWAIVTLQRHRTTVAPNKPADALVTDGPFRFRRNPIYLAHVLMLLGVAEMTENVWFVILAVAYVVLVHWLAVRPEERHLEARFGDAYRAYKESTRPWI